MTRSQFLTLQLAALDALEVKKLSYRSCDKYGNYCAAMVLVKHNKTVPMLEAQMYGMFEVNDLDPAESPAARFVRVRKWVAAQLGGESL